MSSLDILHIGIDDTDSLDGRCTTYLAYNIVHHILENGLGDFIDYPLLIRLNPNIPWKTRGNGAICIRLRTYHRDKIIDYVSEYVEEESAIDTGANPGIVILDSKYVPDVVQEFGRKAMYDILSLEMAEKIARKYNSIDYFTFGNGQGLIGSLAAVGTLLWGDHTFEAIAYRKSENCQTVRMIDASKVIKCSEATFPNTFNSYDFTHHRVLVAPHGPDPVFCGVRGESPEIVLSSLKMIKPEEHLEGYMVFRSNQGTNMHLLNELEFRDIKPHMSGFSICRVNIKPSIVNGGHVILGVEDDHGNSIAAAVYEPTDLANIASKLDIGDEVEIGFGVREATSMHQQVLNVEYLSIIELAQTFRFFNPLCKNCGKRLKSEGKNKGFQCELCGYKGRMDQKIRIDKERNIKTGLYLPPPRSHRHLTKPIHRYGIEKSFLTTDSNFKLSNSWISTKF
jgi:tRNA(Ile2)-agmatinylcytidine synthase